MSLLLVLLMACPLAVGLGLLVARGVARTVLVALGSAVVAGASVAVAVGFGGADRVFVAWPFEASPEHAFLGVELAAAALVAVLAARRRRWDALALAVAQGGFGLWMALSGRLPEGDPARFFVLDRLAVVMVLVVGLIGPLICLHAVGYMKDYHRHHAEVADRQPLFFFVLFAFLAAMFLLVTANHLPALHLAWELTTLCSFVLIGYPGSDEAVGNAFNAVSINLGGGLAFSGALWLLGPTAVGMDLATLCAGPAPAALLPAVALLALAGATKSAQLPFSSWLLGAMVAPSPTSALLHSSTMVKAGVFLVLRLAPAMAGSRVGEAVAALGFATFLVAAVVATTENNAKRVLAWSTIGNLGLAVGCAGVATPATLWVGMMVVVFHAAAKSLLFLTVGTIENRLGSKDLERFDHLLVRFPRLGTILVMGVTGMFVAPFGVVLAKWSAIRALVELPGWQGPLYLLAMAYGSAATIYFWTKLLLKLIAVRELEADEKQGEGEVSTLEWLSEWSHVALVVALTLGVGQLSAQVVSPGALFAFGAPPAPLFHLAWPLVVVLAAAVLSLPALAAWVHWRGKYDLSDVYAGGRPVESHHRVQSAAGGVAPVELRNYYLQGVIDGPLVFKVGRVLGAGLVLLLVVVSLGGQS